MAFRKTDVRLETLTLDLAKQFAAMPGLLGERPLRDSRLHFLDKERREGRFISPSWATVVESSTGQRFRLNGQHSSTMLARLEPEAFPADLLVTIEEFTSDDLAHDALRMFNLFDNPRAARTNTDVMGLYRAEYQELAGIDLGLLVSLCNGIAQYEANRPDDGVKLEPRERGGYLMRPDYREFVRWAATYDQEEINGEDVTHGWMLRKPGIVAEMLTDRMADQAHAERFWGWAFMENHPDKDHESREITRALKELAPKPRMGQERLQKEAAKHWKRYRRSIVGVPAAA